MSFLHSLTESVLHLLFPPRCRACGELIQDGNQQLLCSHCKGLAKVILPPVCDCCGGRMDAPCLCRKVTVGRLAFHKARSAVPYESPFRELILQFKFQGSYRVRPFLCETFLEGYRRFYQVESFEAIVPVPLHWFRRFQREFNQAEVLGEALAAELGIPLISRALHRTRRTLPQSSLAGRWRIDNLKGAFSLGSDFHPGMKLLLVDDVMTTGMTLNACAEVLRLGGATEVHAFTLARRM